MPMLSWYDSAAHNCTIVVATYIHLNVHNNKLPCIPLGIV